MKFIFSILFLTAIVYGVKVNADINVDLNLVHQQNTETLSPIVFEPGPVFNEIYVTPTFTPTMSPTVTPTETFILYETDNTKVNTNDNTNNPPSSFVIQQSQHIQQNQHYQHNKQNHISQEQRDNHNNQHNILFPNLPLY